MAAPKYLPLCAAAPPSVLAAPATPGDSTRAVADKPAVARTVTAVRMRRRPSEPMVIATLDSSEKARLAERPLLVAAAVAGPQFDRRAVGGGSAGDVQAQPGLAARDRAVGVDGPLLVALAVAGPGHDFRAGAGALAGRVEAEGRAAEGGRQPAIRRACPGLVRLSGAAGDLQLRALRRIRRGEALAR